jgi:hypothetical protein
MTFAELVMMPYLFSIENLIKKKTLRRVCIRKIRFNKKRVRKRKK